MKTIYKFFVVLALCSCRIFSMGQSETNYVIKETVAGPQHTLVSTIYFDGLGRQQVSFKGSNLSPDTVVAMLTEYDKNGRDSVNWAKAHLKISELNNLEEVKSDVISYYNDNCPYSTIIYDNPFVDKMTSTTGSGQLWYGDNRVSNNLKLVNSTGKFNCIKLELSSSDEMLLSSGGNYPVGILDVESITDEDGHEEISFKNMFGQLLLTRRILDSNTYADTYYVYDIYGNLCYVLPPKASAELQNAQDCITESNEIIQKLCYVYHYDSKNRCIEKKLPGCAPVYYVYDKFNRPIFSQDGNQRANGQWAFTAYDSFGRVVYSGVKSDSRTADQLRNQYKNLAPRANFDSQQTLGYSIVYENVSLADIKLVNYYDNYDFLDKFASYSDSLEYRVMAGYDSTYVNGSYPSISAKGMLTGTMARTLDAAGTPLVKALYYDYHGNVIQTHENNRLGGYEHAYMHLSFTGKPLAVLHRHSAGSSSHSDLYTYSYDHMERLLTTTLAHDGGSEVTLSSNTYDAIGRLVSNKVNNNTNETSYTYNVRGWMKSLTNNNLSNAQQSLTNENFSETLYYQDAPTGATACYNGNISGITWMQKENVNASTSTSNRYAYSYDGMDRLVQASYSLLGTSVGENLVAMDDRDFTCSYSYDKNGNMTHLQRKGVSGNIAVMSALIRLNETIDNVTMTYDGNQLKSADDGAHELTYSGAMDFKDGADLETEYTYDANGNMTSDRNRGITSITYNMLNLPRLVTFADGHEVLYTYAADGRKLRTEYRLNNFIVVDADGGEMEMDDGTAMGEDLGDDLSDGASGLVDGESDGVGIIEGGSDGVSGLASDGTTATGASDYLTPYTTLMARDYCGSYIYRNDTIERVLTENGYIQNGELFFYVRDYQGNVRVVLDHNSQPVEENSYYPYGGLMAATSTEGTQPYKYGGKELDRENGLDLYDSQARWYDPMLARTTTIDPLAEKYYSISPYAWCAANPVKFIDPTGMDPIYAQKGFLFWRHVKLIGDDGRNLSRSYLVKGKVQKAVEAATKAGDKYNGDLLESNDVMLIPTGLLLQDVINSVNETKESKLENGGHAYVGDVNATRWDEGTPARQEKKDNLIETTASLRPFLVNGIDVEPQDASNLMTFWHVHPNITIGESSLGRANPSKNDFEYQAKMRQYGFKGNAFVVGAGEMNVTFYNERKLLTVSWEDFLKMGGLSE